MTISYPITLPSHSFARVTMTGRSVVASSRSPYSLAEQRFAHPGQIWRAQIELPVLKREDAQPWIAALQSLNGKEGSFLLGDPAGSSPLGSASGTPQVDGGSQTGSTLDTKGWTANETGVLLAGDYIQLGTGAGSQLYMVMTDTDADGSGLATIDIWPDLRSSPSDGDSITTSDTRGVFRRTSNQTPFSVVPPNLYRIQFSAVEVL